MGGPKALVHVGGRALLERHLERLHASGCTSVTAVVRPADADVARAIARRLPFDVTLVAAATPSQAASLASAIGQLVLEDGDVVAITPVDLLPPRPATVRALAAALASASALAATPSFRGQGGHPALVRPEVLAPYVRGEPPPLRDVLEALGARRVRVEVDDAAVTGDFDRPDDLPRRPGTTHAG